MSAHEKRSGASHFLELDGLRGFAAFAVVTQHVTGLMPWAWAMMDFFFALSGFLLTYHYARRLRSRRSIVDYFYQRCKRIWPLYFAAVGACLVIGVIANSDIGYLTVDKWHRYLTFTQYAEAAIEKVDRSQYFSPLTHTWSLAIEEQFYLILPLFLLIGRNRAVLVGVLIAVVMLSVIFKLRGGEFWSIFWHADAFVSGGVAALIMIRGPSATLLALFDHLKYLLAAVGIVTILQGYAEAGVEADDMFLNPARLGVVLNIGWGVVIVLVACRAGSLGLRFFRWRPFVLTGKVSYSLYVVHIPVLVFTQLASMKLQSHFSIAYWNGLANIVSIPLIVLTTFVAYRYLDKPFKRTRHDRHLASLAAQPSHCNLETT